MVNFDQGKRNLVRDSGEFDFSEFQFPGSTVTTATWLAQLGARRSAKRVVAGSIPDRTKPQGL